MGRRRGAKVEHKACVTLGAWIQNEKPPRLVRHLDESYWREEVAASLSPLIL